jgi:hypothetical protein
MRKKPLHIIDVIESEATTAKIVVWILKILSTELAYNPAIPLLCNIPRRTENRDSNKHLYKHVDRNIIHNIQDVETTEGSTNVRMYKQNM